MSQPTPMRPVAEKGQISLRQICLITLVVAVIMAMDMSVTDRVFWSIVAVCAGLVADWHTDLLTRASRAIQEGDEEAHALIDKYIDRRPNDSSGYSWRGYMLLTQDELLPAQADFEKAIELKPEDGHSWLWKGVIQLRQERFDDAITTLNNAGLIIPDEPQVYWYRWNAEYCAGKLEFAEQDALELLDVSPDEPTAWSYYTTVLFAQGRYEERLEFSKDKPPESLAAEVNIAFCKFKLGLHREAIEKLATLCADNPDAYEPHAIYGWMLATCPDAGLRNAELALTHAQRAVEIHDGWQTYNSLAAAYAENGQFDAAVNLTEKSLESSWPLYRPALSSRLEDYRAGRAHRDTGQPIWSAPS